LLEFSIIIPTYGRPDKIVKCIESVPSVSFLEIIVVDDNGLDTPNQLLTKKLLTDFKHIRYLALEDNVGAALARNAGVNIANAKYITFLDDDDCFLPDMLLKKFQFMKEEDECDLCCSDMLISKNGKLIDSSQKYFSGTTPLEALERCNCWTPMMTFKKEFFLVIGGFSNVSYKEDNALLLKANIYGADIRHFKHATFIHMIHEDQQITTGNRNCIEGNELVLRLQEDLCKQLILTKWERHIFDFRISRNYLRIKCFYDISRFTLFKFWLANVFLKSRGLIELLKAFKDLKVVINRPNSNI
jgi:glycosyltransferase involved in cell wall biosynthesis